LEQLKLLIEEKNMSIDFSDEQKRLFAINRMAMEYFQNSLSISDTAKKYLEDRGLDTDIIKLFHIGYANPDWTATKQYLLKKGFSEDEILKAGLIFRSSKSNKTYDFYRSRIMFPIIDAWGNVVGFSGRTIVNDKSKYVNTSQTPVFHKRRSFFNLNNFDNKLPYIVICEGQMDVIAFARARVSNAVATLGTALTRSHAYMIAEMAEEVYFCFDGDTAGQSALKKAENLFAEIGNIKTKKMKMPHSCKDADEVLKMFGREGILKLFETAS
jgi:DNA primase